MNDKAPGCKEIQETLLEKYVLEPLYTVITNPGGVLLTGVIGTVSAISGVVDFINGNGLLKGIFSINSKTQKVIGKESDN